MATPEIHAAKAVWVDGMKFAASAGSGHSLMLDADGDHAGENAGFSPMELILVGVAGCTAMDVLAMLREKQQPVEGLEVWVHGQQATQHPKHYTNITLEYHIRGNDIAPHAVREAIEMSENKTCAVLATLGVAPCISTTYQQRGDCHVIRAATRASRYAHERLGCARPLWLAPTPRGRLLILHPSALPFSYSFGSDGRTPFAV